MSTRVRHFILYQFPAVLWAAIIFIASSMPASKLPKIAFLVSDKIVHGAVFFVFGLLVYRALEPKIRVDTIDWRRLLLSISAVVIYGIIDEYHQSFVPGRTVDVLDASADSVGGVLSGIVIYLMNWWRRMRMEMRS